MTANEADADRSGAAFGEPRRAQQRQEQIDQILKDINKLAARLQQVRSGEKGGLGHDEQLRSLEERIRARWDELRALRAGGRAEQRPRRPGSKYS